jgi:hypothetical protein
VPGPGVFFLGFFMWLNFANWLTQKIQKWLKICGFFRFLVAKFREFFILFFLKNRQISLLGSSIKTKF